MITAQDIREKTFKKSKIGGYDMEEIDEFLEAIADDLTNAQKESAVLKSKMKVLVDKIEEYRANENALNQAVLSAQKLAAQIENDAKERAEKLLADAEVQRKEKIAGIAAEVEAENKMLNEAKAESAKFLDGIKMMYSAHLKKIEAITADPAFKEIEKTIAPSAKAVKIEEPVFEQPLTPTPTVDIDETVKELEKNASKFEPEPSIKMDFSNEMADFFASPKQTKDPDRTQPFTL